MISVSVGGGHAYLPESEHTNARYCELDKAGTRHGTQWKIDLNLENQCFLKPLVDFSALTYIKLDGQLGGIS